MTPAQIISRAGTHTNADFVAGDIVAYVPEISRRLGFPGALEFGSVSAKNDEFIFVQFNPDAAAGRAVTASDLVKLESGAQVRNLVASSAEARTTVGELRSVASGKWGHGDTAYHLKLLALAADRIEANERRFEQINTLACYSSEEITDACAASLIAIGKIARGESLS
jgi:hypothetical protein